MDTLREVRCDAMYRLTNEVLDTTLACGGYHATYRYDRVGNRTNMVTVKDSGTTTISYAYNANDQLLQEVRTGGGSGPATTVYGYDANGSLTNKVIGATGDNYGYQYNLQNRLREVTLNGSASTTYLYNDQGIRVRAGDKRYLVDAQNHTGYAQVLEELTVQGSAFAVSRSYTLGDDVLSQSDGTGSPVTSHLLYDGHGSTRLLNGRGATVASRYDYDAYGVSLGTLPSAAATSMLYAGEQWDTNAQQYYLRARYYDPSNGRFNQLDPLTGNNFDPQSLHKYAYTHGNPVDGMDPSGEEELTTQLLKVGVVLVLAVLLLYMYYTHRENAVAIAITDGATLIGESETAGQHFLEDRYDWLGLRNRMSTEIDRRWPTGNVWHNHMMKFRDDLNSGRYQVFMLTPQGSQIAAARGWAAYHSPLKEHGHNAYVRRDLFAIVPEPESSRVIPVQDNEILYLTLLAFGEYQHTDLNPTRKYDADDDAVQAEFSAVRGSMADFSAAHPDYARIAAMRHGNY